AFVDRLLDDDKTVPVPITLLRVLNDIGPVIPLHNHRFFVKRHRWVYESIDVSCRSPKSPRITSNTRHGLSPRSRPFIGFCVISAIPQRQDENTSPCSSQ